MLAAVGKNRELGKDNELIWRISADLKNFKQRTMGHFVLMGRKTFESIGKVLPGRKFLVVSSRPNSLPKLDGLSAFPSVQEAISYAKSQGAEELIGIGGASIYEQMLGSVDEVLLTEIDATSDADVFFPEVDFSAWQRQVQMTEEASEKHPAFEVVSYQKP
jgi:dihydrofolate reductase